MQHKCIYLFIGILFYIQYILLKSQHHNLCYVQPLDAEGMVSRLIVFHSPVADLGRGVRGARPLPPFQIHTYLLLFYYSSIAFNIA